MTILGNKIRIKVTYENLQPGITDWIKFITLDAIINSVNA